MIKKTILFQKGTMLLLQGQMEIKIQYKQTNADRIVSNTEHKHAESIQTVEVKWNAVAMISDRQSPEALSIKDEPLPPRWRERQQRGGLWVSFADRGILTEPHWAECRGQISLLLMLCCVSVQRVGFAAILKKTSLWLSTDIINRRLNLVTIFDRLHYLGHNAKTNKKKYVPKNFLFIILLTFLFYHD